MKKLTITVKEFCEISGLGKTSTYRLIKDGRISTVTVGRRRLIFMDSAEELLSPESTKSVGGVL